jgi:hypothetical protein
MVSRPVVFEILGTIVDIEASATVPRYASPRLKKACGPGMVAHPCAQTAQPLGLTLDIGGRRSMSAA